ncbi:survival protein sure-like phosphatase/nucleotidase [Apodospora peruviana]|uniref:Survival protein sure-like phosphatase/nucleotidase n=1 Tax=Apodospora peruviana TaxID=516989 RepID=A0AAE0I0K7_9PEZI|nr:survival protein sure-like phosphatase/nucleotidase [Apodospora peruviana]
MHILVVNDDGPPSPHSSPYVHSLVRELQAAGHVVSVCLPHTQRSWIGKAHMIGQTVKPLYYRPPPPSAPAAGLTTTSSGGTSTTGGGGEPVTQHGTTHPRPSTRAGQEEWILVDGTPASCVQIGLYHFFRDRGPVDLVVSGPNYGRNTTAVFALSSGTLGGALEAAVCKRRAVALSYAFFSRNHDTGIIEKASRQGVRVIEALWRQWPTDGSVDLYSVNIPLLEKLEEGKVLWTGMLQNYWGEGSCFTEVDGSVDGREEDEERIREGEGGETEVEGQDGGDEDDGGRGFVPHTHKHFKWSPRFTDVYKSVDEAPPGNDGWAVKEGHTSVTPLKANFWHPAAHLERKELQLGTPPKKTLNKAATDSKPNLKADGTHLYALIDYSDDYVQPLILAAMESLLPSQSWTLLGPPAPQAEEGEISLAKLLKDNSPNDDKSKMLQITPYETIDFEFATTSPGNKCLVNSYMIRKALIRKHFLTSTVENWTAKHPTSILKTHVKRSESFEVDYAEFLDDALVEAFDLRASLEKNEALLMSSGGGDKDSSSDKVEWWILKPSMSDRGQGIRLFSTMEQLQEIFDGWEAELSDSDEEDGDDEEDDGAVAPGNEESSSAVNTSHLRHFVVQPYIHPPMLLPEMDNRKFHVRTYVLCVGSLQVYVYGDMLALFAAKPYQPPSSSSGGEDEEMQQIDLDAHLTNTCLQQGQGETNNSVHRFWDLPLPADTARAVFDQICEVTGDVFEAAARGMMVHFQPLENAFEVFGLDFLVDDNGTAWLLEVNAFPDFKQTGELSDVVAGFWKEVLRLAVVPFAAGVGRDKKDEEGSAVADQEKEGSGRSMVLVRELDLGRRW